MSWRSLLAVQTEVVPWTGGSTLMLPDHSVWRTKGRLPEEYGWHRFSFKNREATFEGLAEATPEKLIHKTCGYLVGDRFVADSERAIFANPQEFCEGCPRVFLIEDGLDRFSRVSVGQFYDNGPLIYAGQEMPLGPEGDVLTAFLDQVDSVRAIAGVTPALETAFKLETWQRVETERRRLEEARRRQEEEERFRREAARKELIERLGDSSSRRAMAVHDFDEAARAALAVGGATFLDAKKAPQKGEMVVTFRLDRQRFACTCDSKTLAIIDSGICLTAHYDDDDFEHGTKGDSWLTLESLPSVIQEAIRGGKLVVYRHVN